MVWCIDQLIAILDWLQIGKPHEAEKLRLISRIWNHLLMSDGRSWWTSHFGSSRIHSLHWDRLFSCRVQLKGVSTSVVWQEHHTRLLRFDQPEMAWHPGVVEFWESSWRDRQVKVIDLWHSWCRVFPIHLDEDAMFLPQWMCQYWCSFEDQDWISARPQVDGWNLLELKSDRKLRVERNHQLHFRIVFQERNGMSDQHEIILRSSAPVQQKQQINNRNKKFWLGRDQVKDTPPVIPCRRIVNHFQESCTQLASSMELIKQKFEHSSVHTLLLQRFDPITQKKLITSFPADFWSQLMHRNCDIRQMVCLTPPWWWTQNSLLLLVAMDEPRLEVFCLNRSTGSQRLLSFPSFTDDPVTTMQWRDRDFHRLWCFRTSRLKMSVVPSFFVNSSPSLRQQSYLITLRLQPEDRSSSSVLWRGHLVLTSRAVLQP